MPPPLLLLLLLLPVAAGTPFRGAPTPPKPHLHAVYLAIGNATATVSEQGWLAEFRSMSAVGIRAVIVPHTAHGTADGDTACPGGRFDAYFPVAGGALPGGCFVQVPAAAAGSDTTLMRISRAAAEAGLELHLGLAYPHSHLWQFTDPVSTRSSLSMMALFAAATSLPRKASVTICCSCVDRHCAA